MPFYFSKVEVNGLSNLPKKNTPVILAPNHQNAFLDAIVVAVFYKQPIYFLARASVFKSVFNKFLRAINMRPVFRIRDGYENLTKNNEVFNECEQLLFDGKSLLVFPEADHGEEYYLRTLSRGVPRIAFDSYLNDGVDVEIVPVGINYTDHFCSGGKLFLNFGKALKTSSLINCDASRGSNLNSIRATLYEGLKEVMLLPDRDALYQHKKIFIKKSGEGYGFEKLRMKLNEVGHIEQSRNYFLSVVTLLLTIPNLPFYVLIWSILNAKVPSRIFHASVKYALIMLVSWLWLFMLFTSIAIWKDYLTALFVICIGIVSAYIRTKIVSKTRFYS